MKMILEIFSVIVISVSCSVAGSLDVYLPCKGVSNIRVTYDEIGQGFYLHLPKVIPRHSVVNITLTKQTQRVVPALSSEFSIQRQVVISIYLTEHEKDMTIFLHSNYGRYPEINSILVNNTELCKTPKAGNIYGTEFIEKIGLSAPLDEEEDEDDKDTCGQRKADGSELIIHGQETKPGDWPWHVAIYVLSLETSSIKYICGGTLISRNVVLTAAHCVTNLGTPYIPEIMNVVLGKYNLIGGDISPQNKEVTNIIIHEDYDYLSNSNDIALLKLGTKAAYNKYVQPACLWRTSDFGAVGQTQIFGTVVGWGINENNTLSSQLQQVTMPKVTNIECIKSNPLFTTALDENKFCAGYTNGTSACNGDSGGGFFVFVPDILNDNSVNAAGSYHLRGIASLAVSQREINQCDAFNYVLFIDVVKYLRWIRTNKLKLSSST